MRRFFVLMLPLVLLVPMIPSVPVLAFKIREPHYLNPLGEGAAIQIREDPYGSGFFGAHRNGGRRHLGLDLVAPVGTSVVAAKSGVAAIGRIRNGMGRYIEVHHPDGTLTRYGHLRRILIRDGRWIRRGEPLGTVGKSGNARYRLIQPHLHFEVWNALGTPVDPLSMMETSAEESDRHAA